MQIVKRAAALRMGFDTPVSWVGTMTDELAILHQVTAALDAGEIAYMVTGSIALSVYAEPRMTRDVDIVIELGAQDVDRFADLFDTEFHGDRDRIREAVRTRSMFNLIHTQTIVKVDCVVRKDTPYRLEEFRRRRRVTVAGFPMMVVAPEDLVLSKLDWARDSRSEVQLRDVRLILLSQPDLDWTYLAALLEEVQP
jgi:hypothetical protein